MSILEEKTRTADEGNGETQISKLVQALKEEIYRLMERYSPEN